MITLQSGKTVISDGEEEPDRLAKFDKIIVTQPTNTDNNNS